MNRCTYCGREANSNTEQVGGYTILEVCTDCKDEILEGQQDEQEPTGEFEHLNFIIDHESLDFIGYEFIGEEIFIKEHNDTQSLFRMDVNKQDGSVTVYGAWSDDFDVMDDLTHYFDTMKLYRSIKGWEGTHNLSNEGAVYVEYYKARENGMDSDDAISHAYAVGREPEPLKLGSDMVVIDTSKKCEHTNNETILVGGGETIVVCNDCGEEL